MLTQLRMHFVLGLTQDLLCLCALQWCHSLVFNNCVEQLHQYPWVSCNLRPFNGALQFFCSLATLWFDTKILFYARIPVLQKTVLFYLVSARRSLMWYFLCVLLLSFVRLVNSFDMFILFASVLLVLFHVLVWSVCNWQLYISLFSCLFHVTGWLLGLLLTFLVTRRSLFFLTQFFKV